jgi:AcrR family transcriptional regulator
MPKSYDQFHAVTANAQRHPSRLVLPRFSDRAKGREGQILVAALLCIVEKGLAATTTRAVASMANLNQGAIHYYFRSKDELFLGVLKGLMDTATANARTVRDSALDPVEKIEWILHSAAAFIQEDEVVASVSLWAHAISKGGIWRDAYRRLFEEFRQVIVEILDEGLEKKKFEFSSCEAIAETIITAVQGIGMHYVMSPSDFASYGLMERLRDVYFPLLGVRHDDRRAAPTGEGKG